MSLPGRQRLHRPHHRQHPCQEHQRRRWKGGGPPRRQGNRLRSKLSAIPQHEIGQSEISSERIRQGDLNNSLLINSLFTFRRLGQKATDLLVGIIGIFYQDIGTRQWIKITLHNDIKAWANS